MILSLAEVLDHIDLAPGQIYRCQLKGHWVELRVLGPAGTLPSARFDESDIRLDPWVEFPPLAVTARVTGRMGTTPLPDVPEIPHDGEDA